MTDTPVEEESTPTTHYSLLGVSRDASDDEIDAAYREKALEYHPDVSDAPRSDEYMTYLNRARETLLDPAKRTAYDDKLEEMGIEPPSSRPAGQTQSAHPPRRESMDYFSDRERPVELSYPEGPFADRVTNLAVRSWILRTVLAVAVAVAIVLVDVEWTVGTVRPIVSPLSDLLVAVAVIFALDAVRVSRRYPRLDAEEPTRSPGRLIPSVRLGLFGATLWTGALLSGGQPHAFVGQILVPLTGAAVPVAMCCRYFSLPRRLLLWISGAAGAAVAFPFLAKAPPFLPADRFPTTELVGMILGGSLGFVAVLAIGVAIIFGAPAVSRLAWAIRCRSTVPVVPQGWDALLVLPIVLTVLSLSASLGDRSVILDPYASAAIASGLEPALAGLVLAWTVPAVAIAIAGRLWLGTALATVTRRVRTR